jgi:hypothetical protein
MAYEGYVDFSSAAEIRGWVYDNAAPNEPVTVEIFSDGRLVASMAASQFRADLVTHQKGNGNHAFVYRHAAHETPAVPLTARILGKRWELPLSGQAAKPSYPRRYDRLLAHSLEYGLPTGECAFSRTESSSEEPAIADRLITAYHRALQDDPRKQADQKWDLWSEVGAAHHREILELLRKRDVHGTAEYLHNAHARGLTFGITQGTETTERLRTEIDARRFTGTFYFDALSSLAEYLGILDLECPEQGPRWGENMHGDPEELIARISDTVGFPIVYPPVANWSFGIKTKDGMLSGRDIAALYAALRLRSIAQNLRIESPEICEIGGGLGATAHYASRLGLGRYTIIDLPLIGVLQGHFLLRTLPTAKIVLYGEEEQTPASIRVLPTYCFQNLDSQHDLLFNQDSMPEMHSEYSLAYLSHARHNVRHAFLSINQESRAPQSASNRQTVVRELVREAGGFRLSYRFRHWLRAGYAEELFTRTDGAGFKSANSAS